MMIRSERALPFAASPGDLFALVKPRIMMMALATMAGAMALAPGSPPIERILAALIGTGLIVGAANTLNMYLEREVDCLMARTRSRPLPAGRLDPAAALVFGVVQAVVALPLLTFAINPLTGLLGASALVAYVMVYTPLKQRSTVATWVGAFPGAAPALMGWTAATGSLFGAGGGLAGDGGLAGLGGLAVFGVLFLWQIPHFHAIALFRRKDYKRAGLKILPVERGDDATRRQIALQLAVQVGLSLALYWPLGVAGPVYFAVAALTGGAYLGYGVYGWAVGAGPRWARNLFLASIAYLPVLFAVLIVDGRL